MIKYVCIEINLLLLIILCAFMLRESTFLLDFSAFIGVFASNFMIKQMFL